MQGKDGRRYHSRGDDGVDIRRLVNVLVDDKVIRQRSHYPLKPYPFVGEEVV